MAMRTRRSSLALAGIVGLGVVCSLVAGLSVHRGQLGDARATFGRLTQQRAGAVRQQVVAQIQALRALKALYAASQQVDEAEFVTFVDDWLPAAERARQVAPLALGWLPADRSDPGLIRIDRGSVRLPVPATPEAAAFLDHLPELTVAGELIARTGILFRNLAKVRPGHAVTLFAPLDRAGAFGEEHLRGYLFAVLDLNSLLRAVPSAAPVFERSSLLIGGDASVIAAYPPELAGATAGDALTASSALEFPGFRLDLEFVGDPKTFRPPFWTDALALMSLASGLVVTLILASYVRAMMIRNRALQEASLAAERASTMKSEFLATMSHEIRTPMNAVLGMTELLIDSELEARQMRYARSAFTSAEQLLRILDDILDFSKIELGRLELDPVAIDLLELIDGLGDLFAVQTREKAVEFVTRYLPGTERFVLADPVRLRQIITNLAANAIKFTEQGHIVLTVEQRHDAPDGDGRVTLRISIEDTGIGIAPAAQARLFQRFEQLDGAIARKYGGTGLGLAICRQLVELMGGEIGVESTPGRGSTFWFMLTLRRHQADGVPPPLASSSEDVRILVVDQLPINRTLVAEQLELHGMRCAGAPGGEDALRQLREAARAADPFQIVLIDGSMPGRNDARLAQSIKAEPTLRNAALIMFSAAGGGDLREVCAERGFSGHVAKPIRIAQLIEVLTARLPERSRRRPGRPGALAGGRRRGALPTHRLAVRRRPGAARRGQPSPPGVRRRRPRTAGLRGHGRR